jgi:hypothetical protein
MQSRLVLILTHTCSRDALRQQHIAAEEAHKVTQTKLYETTQELDACKAKIGTFEDELSKSTEAANKMQHDVDRLSSKITVDMCIDLSIIGTSCPASQSLSVHLP